jgi:hypothetical protein
MKQKGAQTTPAQQEINQDIVSAPLVLRAGQFVILF